MYVNECYMRVDWRGNEFAVDADGVMRRLT
jgi:hypothetical protein